MASSSWTDVEDIALCEAWEEAITDPPRRGQGVMGPCPTIFCTTTWSGPQPHRRRVIFKVPRHPLGL
ncbi:hypothetical protein Hanom_Chr12g01170531 [Helianthus anomalus]